MAKNTSKTVLKIGKGKSASLAGRHRAKTLVKVSSPFFLYSRYQVSSTMRLGSPLPVTSIGEGSGEGWGIGSTICPFKLGQVLWWGYRYWGKGKRKSREAPRFQGQVCCRHSLQAASLRLYNHVVLACEAVHTKSGGASVTFTKSR